MLQQQHIATILMSSGGTVDPLPPNACIVSSLWCSANPGSPSAGPWTHGLADWISGHVGAFEAIGGVPALDNTKVAVIKGCLYDPQISASQCLPGPYGLRVDFLDKP